MMNFLSLASDNKTYANKVWRLQLFGDLRPITFDLNKRLDFLKVVFSGGKQFDPTLHISRKTNLIST